MDIIPAGGRIVEACQHGNPMDLPCKLCGRVGNPDLALAQAGAAVDPNAEIKNELLAIAYGLIAGVDNGKADKQSKDWQASSAEWVERYGILTSGGTLAEPS